MIELSVIVPAYRAKRIAETNVWALHRCLLPWDVPFEILLVDDGSGAKHLPNPGALPPTCRLLRLEKNRGKGAAVKAGFNAAGGKVICFLDVDLPFDFACLAEAYGLIRDGACFVAGDRHHPRSRVEANLPWVRRGLSFLFAYVVSRFLSRPVSDTQCGFKAMKRELWKAMGPLTRVERFAFDVEWYEILGVNEITPKRIPVILRPAEGSSVSFLREAGRTFWDLTKLIWRSRRHRYHSEAVRAVGRSNSNLINKLNDPLTRKG